MELSIDLGHSSLPQSTEGLGGNTSLPNPDSFVKIPQLICEQSSSPISREPSSSFLNNNTLPQYVNNPTCTFLHVLSLVV